MRSLQLRLLKRGMTVEASFGPSFSLDAPRALRELAWRQQGGGRLFVGQIFEKAPVWLPFLREGANNLDDDLVASGAGAVLFIEVERRIVAVCFGHVHLALDDDAFERRFGLKVVLNTVPRTQLRTLDLTTPDANAFQRRLQASVDSDLNEFGVDVIRDLARVAGGTPSEAAFARVAAGKDSLSLSCEVAPDTLAAKCGEAVVRYRQRTYRNEYPWVDNMRPVEDGDVLSELNTQLFRQLTAVRAGQDSELHLAPPEIVDYTDGMLLHYNGFGSHGVEFTSLSIFDYARELNRAAFDGGIDDVKARHRVASQVPGSDAFAKRWSVYDCFVTEISLGTGNANKYYVLFGGDWYEINRDFRRKVNEAFEAVPKRDLIGPTQCVNERELLAELERTRDDMLLLDQTRINPDGENNANLEPCDFFMENLTFIHLKDGHASTSMSHLWFQGVVSAEGLIADRGFRRQLRRLVSERDRRFARNLPANGGVVERSHVTVYYGIMRKPYRNGTLGLPFFSKLSLRTAMDRLNQLGVRVALELIAKPGADQIED